MIDDEMEHPPHPDSKRWWRGRSQGVTGEVVWTLHAKGDEP